MLPLSNWHYNVTLFFANALSDDENVRKRELQQVVDAFEYYVQILCTIVEQSGIVILSTTTVGDYSATAFVVALLYFDDITHNNQP